MKGKFITINPEIEMDIRHNVVELHVYSNAHSERISATLSEEEARRMAAELQAALGYSGLLPKKWLRRGDYPWTRL